MLSNSETKDEESLNKKNSNNIKSDTIINILDGAKSQFPPIAPELDSQRKIAADKNLSLEVRLEAFEDIIDFEIGDTNLTRARNIERSFGFSLF